MSGESSLEQERRLLAMAEDDGDTWDLSDNDRAACRAGAKAMEAARCKTLKSLARSRERLVAAALAKHGEDA